MKNWTEIRTAYHVGRLGTVSAAAAFLGVHRATVVRHIDALEESFGEKVFHRHAKGYAPTEVGRGLMRIAESTEDQFKHLMSKTRGRDKELLGEFIITSADAAAPVLMPVLSEFLEEYPQLLLRYISGHELLKLEYGEAHCALRLGQKPQHGDHVVLPFAKLELGLYASRGYIAKHGRPRGEDFNDHQFLGLEAEHECSPCGPWIRARVAESSIAFRSTSPQVLDEALLSGLGLGIMATEQARRLGNEVELVHTEADWAIPIWLVTHVDLHRSAKVQAFTAFLKRAGYLSTEAPRFDSENHPSLRSRP